MSMSLLRFGKKLDAHVSTSMFSMSDINPMWLLAKSKVTLFDFNASEELVG